MGIPITRTRAPFYIGSFKGNFLFLRGEDFSGFSPEPFPGATTAAATTTTATTITTTTPIITTITATITATATATGGTPIKVKAFPSGETFQKVSASTSL